MLSVESGGFSWGLGLGSSSTLITWRDFFFEVVPYDWAGVLDMEDVGNETSLQRFWLFPMAMQLTG